MSALGFWFGGPERSNNRSVLSARQQIDTRNDQDGHTTSDRAIDPWISMPHHSIGDTRRTNIGKNHQNQDYQYLHPASLAGPLKLLCSLTLAEKPCGNLRIG